ncbi:MAG: DUF4124 domain-containing protein [Deltaproteobacteria bacterium]|nr:DUF4124 domain-containing protein [Deltaproteobacteria bacterium]
MMTQKYPMGMTSAAILAAMCLLLAAGSAGAKMYKYTDDDGQVHVVDSMNKVPPKYRQQMELRRPAGVPSAPPAEEAKTEGGEEGAAKPAEGEAAKEGEKKPDGPVKDEKYWRGRIEKCERDLRTVEHREGLLSEELTGAEAGAEERFKELEKTRAQLQDFRRQCAAIREEGRKAGAPAGWLR